jgi:hypothetical protein
MIWILLPIGFAGFWFGVSQMLASLSGWRELAVSYAAKSHVNGRAKSTGGRVGSVAYNGCLRVGVDPAGLSVCVFLPFRPGHSPLLIPWSHVSADMHSDAGQAVCRLRFRAASDVPLEIPRAIAIWLNQEAPRSFLPESKSS